MTQATNQPSAATRRSGGSQTRPNEYDPRSEQDLHGEQDLVGDRDRDDGNDRNERDSYDEQSEQRARREDRADDRDDRNDRIGRDSRDEQSDQRQRGEQWHGDRGELGDGREPRREPGGVQRSLEQVTDRVRTATSNPADAFTPTPDMSKVVTAWFDMTGDMMKLQQQFFATMLAAGNTDARTTTKL